MENGIPPPLRPEDSRPECADQCWEKCLSRKDFECCQTADFGGKTLIVYGHSVDGCRDVFNFFIKEKRKIYCRLCFFRGAVLGFKEKFIRTCCIFFSPALFFFFFVGALLV